MRSDGSYGFGCTPCTPTDAWGLHHDRVYRIFCKHGTLEQGCWQIASGRKLRDALIAEGLATGNATGEMMISAIKRDHCRQSESAPDPGRPIALSGGKNNAVIFTWVGDAPSEGAHVA